MTSTIGKMTIGRTLLATTVASVLLAACATSPSAPEGAADVRARLTQLQSDPTWPRALRSPSRKRMPR